jgi:hypothetical protein
MPFTALGTADAQAVGSTPLRSVLKTMTLVRLVLPVDWNPAQNVLSVNWSAVEALPMTAAARPAARVAPWSVIRLRMAPPKSTSPASNVSRIGRTIADSTMIDPPSPWHRVRGAGSGVGVRLRA